MSLSGGLCPQLRCRWRRSLACLQFVVPASRAATAQCPCHPITGPLRGEPVQCSEFGSSVTSLWTVRYQILPRFQPGALIGLHRHCAATARFGVCEPFAQRALRHRSGILRCNITFFGIRSLLHSFHAQRISRLRRYFHRHFGCNGDLVKTTVCAR
jgi:hypothetical protein